MFSFRRSITALAVAATLGGCAAQTSGPPSAAAVRQEQQQSQQLVAQLRQKNQLINDRSLNGYMGQIVQRVSSGRTSGLPPIKYYVVKDADVNAFTTGGGYIFINAGLIAAMENEAQLAMVVAHEIAHVDRGHIQRGKETRAMAGILGTVASIGAAAAGVNTQLAGLGIGLAQNAAVNTFTREQETDADNIGLAYLSSGGYNGKEGAKSFEVLRRLYGQSNNQLSNFLFASHPQSTERQASLTAAAARSGGKRVATQEYLRKTHKLRVDVKKFLDSEGRTKEAQQLARNIRRMR